MAIKIQNRLIEFCRNPAGYTEDSKAVVDSMFENEELVEFLEEKGYELEFRSDIFENLIKNRHYYENENAVPLKNVRIWQLKRDVDIGMKFISFEEMVKDFGEPSKEDYKVVFDDKLSTNNLDEIYSMCNTNHPKGYSGHSLSMSDVIELYDKQKSSYHYVDRFGFKEIKFEYEKEQSQKQEEEEVKSIEMEMQGM